MASPEERILELLEQASPEAMELLYDHYGSLAYTLANRVLNDEGAAEDVVQEAFLAIWRQAATYEAGRGSLRTWLCTIVRNRAIDRLRGRRRRARQTLPLDLVTAPSSLPDTWASVATELERDAVRRAVVELPPEQRYTIELAYYSGYTQSEISSLMGVPLGTVKGRTRMALQKLRSSLEARGVGGACHDVF
jgi:RNA polymerase sigma-70 factor, ECF subfamily